jgi:hypothetical protein
LVFCWAVVEGENGSIFAPFRQYNLVDVSVVFGCQINAVDELYFLHQFIDFILMEYGFVVGEEKDSVGSSGC